MTLTGDQVRRACEILRWNRYDLQRATALPLAVVDRMLASGRTVEATLAYEIVVRHALHCAGIDLTADGPRRRS